MTSLTICPECEKRIGVPEGTHETAKVQCPHCEKEFKLAAAVPDDLEPVTVLDPGEGALPAEDESLDLVSEELTDQADDDREQAPVFSFDTGGDAATATVQSTQTATKTSKKAQRQKKKRKGPGLFTNVLGIVVFGVVGLGLGYGILKLVAPERAAPIDKFFGEKWVQVASLWSGVQPSEDGGSEDDNDFVPGGSLPDSEPNYANQVLFTTLLGKPPAEEATLKKVSLDQLSPAIASAGEAVGAEPFDLVKAYVAVCEAGDQMTYLADNRPANEKMLEMEAVMRQLASPERQKKLAKASLHWLRFDERNEKYRDVEGVFLIGKVNQIDAIDEIFCSEIEIGTGKSKRSLLVVSNTHPEFEAGDQGCIVGSAIRDATSRFPGINGALDKFDTDKSTIVLGALALSLSKEEAE